MAVEEHENRGERMHTSAVRYRSTKISPHASLQSSHADFINTNAFVNASRDVSKERSTSKHDSMCSDKAK